jgi:hypothetical protein
MREEGLFIKRLDTQAEVIDVVPLLTCRRPALATERPVDGYQINHRNAGAQMKYA